MMRMTLRRRHNLMMQTQISSMWCFPPIAFEHEEFFVLYVLSDEKSYGASLFCIGLKREK